MIHVIDSHAHIQGGEYDADRSEVIERARAAGVTSIIAPAVDLETARSGLALAEAHAGVYSSAGYHPHEARLLDSEALSEVEKLLSHPKAVAVGEIGLDYYYNHSTREQQIDCLEKMLDLAERHTMLVIVHCRDAWEDADAILASWAKRVAPKFGQRPVGVLHYFSGTPEQARQYIDLGFLISVHTSVTHKKAEQLRQVVAEAPLDALLVETDSPYGSPEPYRGKRNEPAYVIEAVRRIAAVRGVSEEEVASATTANALRLFRIPAEEAIAGFTGAVT